MSLTNGQKKALHVAAKAAGVDEAARRLIQRNVGGFHSAADTTATRQGFIAVMAFYESRCASGRPGALPGFTAGYWKGQDETANPTDAIIYRIRREAKALAMNESQLNAFLAGPHMSSGAYDDVTTCPAYWLRKLLEGLKAIGRRRRRQLTGERT